MPEINRDSINKIVGNIQKGDIIQNVNVADIQEQLNLSQKQIADRQTEINALSFQLTEQRDSVRSLSSMVDTKDIELNTLKDQLKKQGESVTSLNARLDSKDIEITALKDQLKKQSESAGSINSTLANNETELRFLRDQVKTLSDLAKSFDTILISRDDEIDSLRKELRVNSDLANTTSSQLKALQELVNKKDLDIRGLQGQLAEALKNPGKNDDLVFELIHSQSLTRSLTDVLDTKGRRVLDLEDSIIIVKREFDRVKADLDDMKRLYSILQIEKNRLETQLDTALKQTQAAFEMADLSKYLTGVINEFNETVNSGDSSVNYIMKGLDIEMKANVAKTGDGRLLMTAPKLSSNSEDSLSTIKFSIGAAPKIQ